METIEYTVTDLHTGHAAVRGTLADLMLDAHLIPRCGLIPPFRVMAAALLSGGGDGGMSPGCIWSPFALSEEQYWAVVERLEKFTPEDLRSRHRNPQILGEIQPDYGAPETDDYFIWVKSLVHRGLMESK